MNDTDYEKTALSAVDVNKTQAVATPSVEATTMSANVECPVCRTPNPPSERYCIDCGFLLAQQPTEVDLAPESPSVGTLVTPDGVREFALKAGENTVGREGTDILLTHNSVSRRHAKIHVADGRVVVEDTGSTNGTFVDGAKAEPGSPMEVKDGAELRFGNAAVILKLPEREGETREGEAPSEPQMGEGEPREGEAPSEPQTGEGEPREGEAPSEPPAADEPAPALPVARLLSKDGVLTFDLLPGAYTIGRRQGENDIVIPDPYTSGRHADIEVTEDSIKITDIGSSNGTTVNGVALEPNAPCELHPGDDITVGQVALTLEGV